MRSAPLRSITLASAAAALTACGPATSNVTLEVTDRATGAPVRAAHITAAPLKQGLVPLPLNDETLAELLALGATDQQGFTDARGRVRLTLVEGAPYLLFASAPPFTSLDVGDGGDESGITLWELDSDLRTLTPHDDVAGKPVAQRALAVRVAP